MTYWDKYLLIYLHFILRRFFSKYDYIASNGRMITEWWIGQYCCKCCCDLILRPYPDFRLEGLRKPTKTFSEDRRSPDRDLNSGRLEYKAGVLTSRQHRSVMRGREIRVVSIEVWRLNVEKRGVMNRSRDYIGGSTIERQQTMKVLEQWSET
jgi:hypothetical protein